MSAETIVVCFHRLGPYHHARLLAAFEKLDQVVALEWSKKDSTYEWEPVTDSKSFPIITLFQDVEADSRPINEICDRLESAFANRSIQAMAINGWGFRTSLAAVRFCRQKRIPMILMSESTPWDEPRMFLKEWIKRKIVSVFSSALVGGGAHTEYLEQLGLARDSIYTGYDVIDNEYFARGAISDKATQDGQKIHQNLTEPFFLASGRFIPKKNHLMLLSAYSEYRKMAENPWDLVILGDGPLRDSLESQIQMLKLTHCVHLPGFIQYPDLPVYYSLARAFLHPSLTEQWGLVVNEAMASSLPVLVSNRCGCARDLVQEGINGLILDPESPSAWVQGMVQLSSMEASHLEKWGEASQGIIQNLGPKQFALGLEQATVRALNQRVEFTISSSFALLLACLVI